MHQRRARRWAMPLLWMLVRRRSHRRCRAAASRWVEQQHTQRAQTSERVTLLNWGTVHGPRRRRSNKPVAEYLVGVHAHWL